MTRKIMNDYCFVDARNEVTLIDPKDFDGPFCLQGVGAVSNQYLSTSYILKIEDGVVYTYSGSQYVLGNMNEDYRQFIEAKEKGIPIISKWYLRWSLYELYGEVDGKEICVRISKQNKGLITLDDGTEAFVDWRDMGIEQKRLLYYLDKSIKTLTEDDGYEKFVYFNCCPMLYLD